MSEKLLKGKFVADEITENVKKEVSDMKSKGIVPKIAFVRVGDREEDKSYQRAATNRCKKCDIDYINIELNESCTESEYIEQILKLNNDDSVHGILCFRPLPSHIDEFKVMKYINPKKDIDCFTMVNLANTIIDSEQYFPPCTPKGVVEILKHYKVELEGRNVVVIGRSTVVGKPLAMLLLNENCTVTVCHSKTKDLKKIASEADILISCMGRSKLINSEYVKQGSVVIDVGVNFDEEGNMTGDVDMDDVIDKVSKITPVPGGVGAVTTSILASHLIDACKSLNI